MKYEIEIRERLYNTFKKLEKKDKKKLEIINKKVQDIAKDPYRFKPLKKPLQHLRRVHINSNFVLIYSVKEQEKKVVLEDFDHHDKIYMQDIKRVCA